METVEGRGDGPGPEEVQGGLPSKGPFHREIFQFNSWLFCAFLVLAGALWRGMPERYPHRFNLSGEPTQWAEGPGMWILLVSLASLSFGKLHLFQRFVVVDPDSPLLNLPERERFRSLPRERRIPVIRRVNRMLGLMNTGSLVLFSLILLLTWHVALDPASPLAPLGNRALLLVVGAMVVLPFLELSALRGMIRRKLEEEGL